MSPHGSKFKEILRAFVLKTINEPKRKKIKKLIYDLKLLPLKILGIDGLIIKKNEEMDRLKSFLFSLEGKLNVSLYGLPNYSEYKTYSLNTSSFNNLNGKLFTTEKIQRNNLGSERKEILIKVIEQEFSGGSVLLQGCDSSIFVEHILASFANNINFTQLTITDWCLEFLPIVKDDHLAKKVILVPTTPLNSILIHNSNHFDTIISDCRYHHLSPLEQLEFIPEINRVLKPGGKLLLILPLVDSDHYWMDPRALRAYSLDQIHLLLTQEKFNFSKSTLSLDTNFPYCLIIAKK